MQPDNLLIQTIDNLVQETYTPIEPGAAVIVVRDREVIFRKGQGMANLEKGTGKGSGLAFCLFRGKGVRGKGVRALFLNL